MLVLGIESSCDETGVALYDTHLGLLAHALHTQIAMHAEYGGVVPELASRDHIRRVLPLTRQILAESQRQLSDINAIAYTEGPGLAGALLVGTGIAHALGVALDIPVLGVHHLEGHLLSPLLSADPPAYPFVALLVSGGHTQLMHVTDVGQYAMLGDTLDDAAGEAFDKTAQLLGLPYPGGAALSKLAQNGDPTLFRLPRPMQHSGDLNFSFSGLKTAVLTLSQKHPDPADHADIAAAFQLAMTDVLSSKSLAALKATRSKRLVVAGGVGANQQLRTALHAAAKKVGATVYFPELEFCTDNGAMIAYAGAMRLRHGGYAAGKFTVRPRWDLESMEAPA
ncbi:tRNA (adenosine(37)-N6)-threonylcarbamoyltransferase complex transferase subunit TsaD [Sulfuriferula thiophila]|uniref:tRNA (adenosine(37)-N6)-threonylcarbamoyltransferase complex transferase subunit TsaD n=1 Tax=Sulfuriferula thiophila TaxID=1781211 RepID=UPI000F6092DB|nr:tRNA (adenosine(37)-N6)-threonylcarbamoyltransferase complex transferase subunit TsaD [Sulfuriferula thiophila]